MSGGDGELVPEGARARAYCLVPRDLAPKLHEVLRRHFGENPGVEVVVEHRGGERRAAERRVRDGPVACERRRIRNRAGRRVGERRAVVMALHALELPRRARPYAERLVFVECAEPSDQQAEDIDTARIVTHIQAGDREAFAVLYMRYFDRIYSYMRILLRDSHEAEDATQKTFTQVFEAIGAYELRSGRPFRGWLFVIARNLAVSHLRKHERLDLVDPAELSRRDRSVQEPAVLGALHWITDQDLLLFVERLPASQRQVLLLRYMLDFTSSEVAAILGRSVSDVTVLQSRALRFLRERLTAVGRTSEHLDRAPLRRPIRKARILRRRRYALAGR